MSDYKKVKAIRLPFPQSLIDKLNVQSPFDCEDYLQENFGELWDKHSNGFVITPTEDRIYLDYIVNCTYSEGEWGFSWVLNENDFKKYKPLFDKGNFEYDLGDLRKVAYCFYDSCEPPDYYDPQGITFESI